MRWPRVRFTVGRMMVAVAVVGIGCGAVALTRRSTDFRARAGRHRIRAGVERAMLTGFIARNDDPSDPIYASRWRRIAHFRALAQKYDRAARYPFLPVRPDPPEPRWGGGGDAPLSPQPGP